MIDQLDNLSDDSVEALALQVCRPEVGDRVTMTYPASTFSVNMTGTRVGTVKTVLYHDEQPFGVDIVTYPQGALMRVVFDEYVAAGAGMRPWKASDGWQSERTRVKKIKPTKKQITRAKMTVKSFDPDAGLDQ